MANENQSKAAGPLQDVQRDALRKLVELCTRCCALEGQIDQKRGSGLTAEKHRWEKETAELEQALLTRREAMDQQLQQRQATIEQRYQARLQELAESNQTSARRIQHEKDRVEQDLKKQLEQTRWLAESVLEGEQAQHLQLLEQIKSKSNQQMTELEELKQKAFQAVARYGWLLAPVPEPPQEAGLSLEAVKQRIQARQQDLESLDTVGFKMMSVMLRKRSRQRVQDAWDPLAQELDHMAHAIEEEAEAARQEAHAMFIAAEQKCRKEVQTARDKTAPVRAQNAQSAEAKQEKLKADAVARKRGIEAERQKATEECQSWYAQAKRQWEQDSQQQKREVVSRHETNLAGVEQQYQQANAALIGEWNEGLAGIQRPMDVGQGTRGADGGAVGQSADAWVDIEGTEGWTPPKLFPAGVRFGSLRVDLKQITDRVPERLELPESFSVPAMLTFPRGASLVIHADQAGRRPALELLQMVMARLLTQLPAGRARFTIIDPVGLGQNFAGFMHLADYDEALVTSRIWTDSEHIEQRLADLTEHMETVIQKYLRNEFETIDQYNAQAGELAEPYRFLVIADFPTGFEGDAYRRLASIATTGSRCGVYTLILRDTRQPLPQGSRLDEVESSSANIVWKDGKFVWRDEVYQRFPLTIDAPPAEARLTQLMQIVGRAAREAKRVEVSFATIAPKPEQFWTLDTKGDVRVPIGRMGAARSQYLRLGKGVAQHVLIAGKTGSGKSNLLHTIVSNLAMWYAPEQVEFYLVDFKKGVEFKTYASHLLPHARAVAVESDREFGLSVLQRVDAELTRRGELYRKTGVQDLAAYREATGAVMPRTLLIIDEFQEFFSEDDKLAQDSSLLLDRLVRQGRAFGIHVILGSQTIGGTSGLARSTLGQMAVRIALQCSEADSQLILGDNNNAARLLSRPGEAIYNDAGGLVEGNSPFQIAWLPDQQRDEYLDRVEQISRERHAQPAEPIVFEGNQPADLKKNRLLQRFLQPDRTAGSPVRVTSTSIAWLGEPVAIKDRTGILFRRQSGANVLMIGQQEEAALGLLAAAMLSLAAQHAADAASFVILDGAAADSPLAGRLEQVAAMLPQGVKNVAWRDVPEAVNVLAEELARRQAATEGQPAAIFVLIYGLQRYRVLRKQEESFSFGSDDAAKAPVTDKQFADLLREGPGLGIHFMAWADTPAAIERILDRTSIREFDHRILFQMSAADSSNLIDSPAANKLGTNRALAYSEEQGTMAKFRPYALPDAAWLAEAGGWLKGR